MHLVERRNQILAALTEKGSVQVANLANKFGISEVTIRNDFASTAGRRINVITGRWLAKGAEMAKAITK